METPETTGTQFIAGKRRPGTSGEEFAVTNPATGEVLAIDSLAGAQDVDEAVAAARAAFAEWSRTTPVERSEALLRWADQLQARADEFARVESLNAGKPIKLTTGFDVPGTIDNVRFFAGAARNLEGRASGEYSGDHTSTIRREPVGVIGSIAPWNYPLQMAAWKILPAVAAGNTIVLKPSELTPLTSVMFAEAAQAAGIPDGVINVVTGTGPVAGQALITHPDVAMVSFTGSTAVGRQVAAQAAGSAKRVHLELGGKAPFVVFDDADVEAAARGAVAGALINAGQDCTAATRAYVQRPLYEAFVARVAELMDGVRLGPLDDPATDMGSLISFRQRDKVAAMVEDARTAGATVVRGGGIPEGTLGRAAYYEPTLITDAAQDSAIVQQEIFGPVLVCLPFDSDDDALRLANDTPYGLAASAWTTNVYRAGRASREIQAGCVWINDHIPIISEMPHGGYKASGFGKDMSAYSFDEYTNVKHVMTDITGEQHKSWHDTVFTGH
ncbi:gamma-aminobutyraldehyde dehydrogenase [Streptomyces ferrugineus]|uniref:Gamma-aminobutyraldehyde dehydrogenase n=1 Tax=Streptomyces ferrugineus TaxID=1413221 RepID=A0A7M2S9Z7_9ACTN|nr:gamma-aminobutyraldehyde dehydrogenase [Streptomyces ferrugineus]QOV33180.1 gamma-aminobutyraldehyde dehydrogenase [Streptomyces ferrugineus]